jgi:hypothetical protein
MMRGSMLGLIAVIGALVAFRVARVTTFFAQPGALGYVLDLFAILIAYAVAAAWVERSDRSLWTSVRDIAFVVGAGTGMVEIVANAMENGLLPGPHGALVPIASMLVVFGTWGVAGAWTARRLRSVKVAWLAAIGSSMICMLIAVAGGALIELWLVPTDPGAVATWAEFRRSGWNDPVAFQVANTMDAAFSHLLLAPIVATVSGGLGSVLGKATVSGNFGESM